MDISEKIILTAGPTISNLEVDYVNDAVRNGWNFHHSDYIKRFEEAFASYLGVKYAMSTSSCTGALHLALLALGIGPGDEVIVPETTWIATVSAVKYVGATPVFVDIESDTWVMDPDKVEKLITNRTKAIIPVHLYGHPVNMGPILELAEKNGIDILEDAAPSIGAEYNGQKTGSIGRAAAFSFQGAKALVTGEGGMLVSNDKQLMDRARFLNDHGRDPKKTLFNTEIGYKYKMPNIIAALGLAQIQRVEEIVAKKRQIFQWYKERLQDNVHLQLNVERSWAKNIYWMSSVVLNDSLNISRDEFIKQLKQRNIDSRPFFYPVSSMPMFKDVSVDNPVAYKIPLRGINLPSGHERTEEEIDYISQHMNELTTGKNRSSVFFSQGFLGYRNNIMKIFQGYKQLELSSQHSLPMKTKGEKIGQLKPLTANSVNDDKIIELLTSWRGEAQKWFPSQFNVTSNGTKKWIQEQVLNSEDRILFMVEDLAGVQIGHVGLYRVDYKQKHCELDNIIRGNNSTFPGAMTSACETLIHWAFKELGMETLFLRVFSDNDRALRLYSNLGFNEIQRTPLIKIKQGQVTRWIQAINQPYEEIERYFITMKLSRTVWSKYDNSIY